LNYLAHFHLAQSSHGLTVGALLGDFIKGPLAGRHSPAVENGIRLHRNIDGFTDRNLCVKHCQLDFDPRFRRYSGIMTDVVFDHFLSIHWDQFHPQPLAVFSTEVFQRLDASDVLPEAARKLATALRRHDVFQRYQQWPTVASALISIGKRLRSANPLAEAGDELLQHYDQLERTFFEFYPQLQQFCQQQCSEFNSEHSNAGQ